MAKIKRDTLTGRVIRKGIAAKIVAEAVGEITTGCEIYGLTKGQWSLIDLIEYCLETTGPAELIISTWTAANADIGFANALLTNGRIKSILFLVDFSFPSRQPAYTAALREAFGDGAIRLTKNHAKFVTIRNRDWNLVLRTSMNLNENRRLESFEISDSKAMAEFLEEVVAEVFDAQKGTFDKTPTELTNEFFGQWEADGGKQGNGNEKGSQFFGDGVLDSDLRRSGVSYD